VEFLWVNLWHKWAEYFFYGSFFAGIHKRSLPEQSGFEMTMRARRVRRFSSPRHSPCLRHALENPFGPLEENGELTLGEKVA
jgi:hypothetical protein